MASHAVAFSAEDLWNLPDDGMRHELVAGQLRTMTPAGAEHGRVAMTAGRLLSVHVQATDTGVTFGAETGFVLGRDPDTVRAPDAAFVGKTRADAVGRTVDLSDAVPGWRVAVADFFA